MGGVIRGIVAISLWCTVTGLVAAQPPWNVRAAGHIGGWCRTVEVVGHYAYIAEGGNLTILDVSNPSSPLLVGHFSFGEFHVNDIQLKSGIAYMAGGSFVGRHGLQIVDLTNPGSPCILGFCPTPAPATAVCLNDNLIYLSIGYGLGYSPAGGIQIVDASDPSSPTLRGSFMTLPFTAWDVYTTGGIAYVACDDGLHILDVTNPSETKHLTLYNQHYCNAVLVSGGLAYTGTDDGLEIVDVTSPTAPIGRGNLWCDQAFDLSLCNGFVFLAEFSPSGLRIIDVANPSSPTLRGSFDTESFSWGVAVSSGTAYLADGPGGLRIVDVANPSSPTLRSTYETLSDARDVYVAGGVAYVANGVRGLKTIDVSDPWCPRILGSLSTPGDAEKIDVSGGQAYICSNDVYRGILYIIDVTNRTSPRLVGSYITPTGARDVAASGSLACFVSDGLHIVDVTNPSSPTLRGSLDLPGWPWDIFVSGNLAYIDALSSLQIVDVGNPTSPVLRSSFPASGSIYYMCVSDGIAYVSGRWANADFECIDVRNPDAPRLLGKYDIPGQTDGGGLYVSNGLAYTVLMGLRVLDVRNPSSPTLRGYYPSGGFVGLPRNVFADGDLAYLTDPHGLRIFQFTGSLTDASRWPLYR